MKKRKKNKSPAANSTPEPEVSLAEEFGETESPAAEAAMPADAAESGEESAPDAAAGPAEPEIAEAEETVEASGNLEDEPSSETPIENIEELPAEDAEASEPEGAEAPAEEEKEPPFPLSKIVEAILFASQKPVSAKELIGILKSAADAGKENPLSPAAPYAKVKELHLREAIEELENACMDSSRTYEVRENAAGWQLVTKPEFSPWLRQLYPENRSARMSAPAMETLAIIAYRQPITRADIEAVRGVAVDGVMQTLLDRGLVKIAGRAEVPGRPLLYETTQHFMEHFGLKNLDDLPNAGELRTIKLPQAAPAEAEAQPATETPAETSETPADAPADVPSEAASSEDASGEPASDSPPEDAPQEEPPAAETDEAPAVAEESGEEPTDESQEQAEEHASEQP